jgi:hypothetical protein
MNSPPVFRLLELSFIELEYAVADLRLSTASLSESLNFVGLEGDIVNITAVAKRVLEAERAVQSYIVDQLNPEIHLI